jgi:hypothetical protein
MKKRDRRGGAGRGQGRKPLPDSSKRTIRKLYQWTPDEYAKIQQAVEKSGLMESKIVQTGMMNEVESILTTAPDGEQGAVVDLKDGGEQS